MGRLFEYIHNLFFDFLQAYDSIKRDLLNAEFSNLKKIQILKTCVNGCSCILRVSNQLSEPFEIDPVVKQGTQCHLSSLIL